MRKIAVMKAGLATVCATVGAEFGMGRRRLIVDIEMISSDGLCEALIYEGDPTPIAAPEPAKEASTEKQEAAESPEVVLRPTGIVN